jgi:thioredoxin 1
MRRIRKAGSGRKVSGQTAVVELTLENWESTARGCDLVLVTFWTDWCIRCTDFQPLFDRASRRHTDVVFGMVNIEDEKKLAAELGVFDVPTLMVLIDNTICYEQQDVLSEPELEELICQAREGKLGATAL